MKYSLSQFYKAIGISKQAVYQYRKRELELEQKLMLLVADAEQLRKEHPGCGVEKMYYVLNPGFVGRDKFIEIMMDVGFRLKSPKNYKRTTYASSIYYPNLIKGLKVNDPCVVWQSDITYILINNEFYYAVFIIDIYSKKIVGYEVSLNMRAIDNVKALAMALKTHQAPKIHHSDRGTQYTSKEYTSLLKQHNTQISMSLNAQENAYAERINRTIKEEYLERWKPNSFCELKKQIRKAVDNYNTHRPHNSLNRMTPVEFEKRCVNDPNFIKPRITIFNDKLV